MITLDADKLSVTEINRALREAGEAGEEVEVINTRARHHLGVGILAPVKVTFRGSVGYFCGGLCDGPVINVLGSVGWCAADNFMSGELIVEKNAGSCVAPGMRGGTLLVKGNIGSRAGQVMKDGNIIVGGNAGFMTGFMLINGNIIILGNAGDLLGHYMIGGSIFVGGQILSLGVDAEEAEVTPGDKLFLEKILDQYKLPNPGRFRKFVSGKKYHHYGKRVY